MELTYENIKSIILGILIVTSLLLTWNLWTYQPSYEELPNSKVVKDVSLGPEKKISDIVRPNQVVFHLNNQYFGTTSDLEIEKVMSEMRGWTLGNFTNISSEVANISSLISRDEMVEIFYPGSISLNTFKSIIPIKDVPNFTFDQIVINMDVQQRNNGIIYFVSQGERRIYETPVPASFIVEFKQRYSEYALQQYTKYVPYRLATEKPIYLPEGETILDSYNYLFKDIDSEDLKNALFIDPSVVEKNYISTGKEFTDGQSLMREDLDSSMIYYVNSAVADNLEDDSEDLLQRSINFVNGHGGFTDNYRYSGIDREQKSVLFRLYDTGGHPIFGQNDPMSEIRLVWGESDISRYVRNNFYLGLLTQTNKVKLISGPEMVNSLIMKGYDIDRIENIVIGYQMSKQDAQSLLIYLEPRWYILYDGIWESFTFGGTGGEIDGLE
ncbi:YycH family regulatory protein [Bacillus benzoevorans]|uniref:Regulatory protein YycH of two-component signal transduction system YycFG n=1 Tax=Bacillus benzoevorans TaxID=1456 RepID=A0A7X0LVB2_9BACI|nr:two-component system activity regulator YycH [Bacillus benzoevorans]MBB6445438.1 regulatory protein YycH of two-component signal transduction system YycFG [Bacillus benzoevorans]